MKSPTPEDTMREEQAKTCPARVYTGSFSGHTCGKTGKFEHDGKWYCGTHHPPAVWAKREAKSAAWDAEFARKRELQAAVNAAAREQQRRADLYPDLLNELQEILAWAIKEGAPLREQEIKSISALIAKATGRSE